MRFVAVPCMALFPAYRIQPRSGIALPRLCVDSIPNGAEFLLGVSCGTDQQHQPVSFRISWTSRVRNRRRSDFYSADLVFCRDEASKDQLCHSMAGSPNGRRNAPVFVSHCRDSIRRRKLLPRSGVPIVFAHVQQPAAGSIGYGHCVRIGPPGSRGERAVLFTILYGLFDQIVVYLTGTLYVMMAVHFLYDLIAGLVLSRYAKPVGT